MKGFHGKPELIFFILILIFVLIMVFASGLLNGWFNGLASEVSGVTG